MEKNKNIYVAIMAGGIGSRFWPLSRVNYPKQFLDILGTGKTLIQQTFDRFTKLVPVENIFVVTANEYLKITHKQLPQLPKENILGEPFRKNTAPCIAYISFKLQKLELDDDVIMISKSGESPEIKVLVPLIKNFGNCLLSITGNLSSYLAKKSDFVFDTTVEQEACPNNLAPTTSTTAQMVMGDVIAVCLMEKRGFKMEDFAKYHPGGALGKKLYLTVKDLYIDHEKPEVKTDHSIKEVIMEMTRKRLGVTGVTGNDGKLVGIITDGDLRRMLEKSDSIQNITARDIMTQNPKTIDPSEMAVNALDVMRKNSITQLVVAEGETYLGILHLHDLVKEGLI